MSEKLSQYKLIFVHGYTASVNGDWYPAIKPMLDEIGADYVIPNLPGYKKPHSDEWLKIIDSEVSKTDKPVVLIGHSLGTRAVLLYLDQYEKSVQQVILIAPLNNRDINAERKDGDAYPDFFEYEIDLNKVKGFSKKWLILHSKDDYSVDYKEHGLVLSEEMHVELKTFDDRSHFTKLEDAKVIFDTLISQLDL